MSRNKATKEPPPPPQPPLPTPTRQQKLHTFLSSVEDKVANMLDGQKMSLPNSKTPFIAKQAQTGEALSTKLKEMQKSRLRMQSQLNSLTEEESQLKNKHRITSKSRINDKNISRIREKSNLTQEDVALLRRLKKEQREFERSLQEKTKAHEEAQSKMRAQAMALKEKQKKDMSEVRAKEVKKRLDQLEQQRQEKQKKFEEEKRKLAEIQAKRKLHEEMDRAQKIKDKRQMEEKVKKMTERMKFREVDLEAISQHQEKYRDFKAQLRANKEQKQEQFMQENQERREENSKVEKSKYYTLIVDEERRRKQQFGLKQRKRVQLHQASLQYGQTVRRDHSPPVRVKTESSDEDKKGTQRREGLSNDEMKDAGNKYMQLARALMKKKDNNKSTNLSSQQDSIGSNNQTNSTKYRDYLSQRRKDRGINDKNKMNRTEDGGIRDRFIRRDVEQVEKIMRSGTMKGEKMERIRNIAEKLEVEKGDHSMLDKISAKLKILESLASN